MQDLEMRPYVLTVILNWRTAEMSLRATEAARLAMQGLRGAIILVDNASGDGSFEAFTKAAEDRAWKAAEVPVWLVQSGRNGGFGAGNNCGILAGFERAKAAGVAPDYIYLLNSDAFPEPDAIAALSDHLTRHPKTGCVGSFIYGEDGAPHRTAFRFPSALGEFEANIRFGPVTKLLKNHVVAMPLPDKVTAVDWLAGASLMLRRQLLEEIGLFDESFFLYFEETDLCHRAALAGWACDYLPESRVMHIGSVSTGMKLWQRVPGFWLDSRAHYFTANHGRLGLARATSALALGAVFWRLRCLVQRKSPQDPPHFLRDLLAHHLPKLWPWAQVRPRHIPKLPAQRIQERRG